MELMSISLDKFYKYVYGTMQNRIPEEILGKITVAVSIKPTGHLHRCRFYDSLLMTLTFLVHLS